MTRKEFLQTAAGAVAASAIPATASAAAERRGPKRGVSVYSYVSDLNIDHTLWDCLEEIGDMGTEHYDLGIEILTGAIEGYPTPSDAWVKQWHDTCAKYHVKPVELGHWIDSKLHNEYAPWLSAKESYDQGVQDIKLANRLGFTCGRTKIGVIDVELHPVPNWKEFIKMLIPVAQKYNFRMLTEVHTPTLLKSSVLDEYVDFITKEKCTPWFGINIDFGVFQNKTAPGRGGVGQPAGTPLKEGTYSKPEDIIPLLPYVHCCHAKFNQITDECETPNIPYGEVLAILVKHNWNNYMVSEYEGDRSNNGAFDAVRKQHVMMRRLLGEA